MRMRVRDRDRSRMADRTNLCQFQILCHDVEDQEACVVRYLKQILSELVDM